VSDLTENLTARLEAAERVCLLFGWTSLGDDSDLSKALHETWGRWASVVGPAFTNRAAYPELSEVISDLARCRDITRENALAMLRGNDA